MAFPRRRVRRPVRHLPAGRQPRRQRHGRTPDAVHRRRRPLHGIADGAAEDGARRLARDHLHERVPLRARNGRRPCGRQPARQVVQHEDRSAERRSVVAEEALYWNWDGVNFWRSGWLRSASLSSSSGGGACGRRRRPLAAGPVPSISLQLFLLQPIVGRVSPRLAGHASAGVSDGYFAVHARRRARRPHPADRSYRRRGAGLAEGPSFGTAGGWGTVRYPDAAFDPGNGVYLTVSGHLTHGRFVTADGVPLGGQFYVPTVLSHNQTARVAYSPDLGGFLVVWYDTRVNPNAYQVWGRVVRFGPNGAPLFTGPDFFIGAPAGGGNAEFGLDVGYATGRGASSSRTTRFATDDIAAQLVDLNGSLVGGQQVLTGEGHSANRASPTARATTRSWWRGATTTARAPFTSAPSPRLPAGSAPRAKSARAPPSTCHSSSTTRHAAVLRRLVHAAQRLRPPDRGRRHADRRPVAARLQLLHLRRARPVHNPVADAYFAVFHGRGREDAGARSRPRARPTSSST